jgi:hypothetical protein
MNLCSVLQGQGIVLTVEVGAFENTHQGIGVQLCRGQVKNVGFVRLRRGSSRMPR